MNQRIQAILDPWISQALLEESVDDYQTYITAGFSRYIKNEKNRQFTIDQLINSKKNLTGNAAQNIIKLYKSLNLEIDSLQKLRSPKWYKIAKGIYELYMMHQIQVQSEILKYTNSKNEYIRMEAQTAVVGFLGFDGLAFLNTLTNPLTSWQQIKLIEQLKTLNLTEEIMNLPNWLKSENDSVVLFALRLSEIYQQMQVHDYAVNCLSHINEKIRRQAVETLAKIANENTATILIGHYEKETLINKRTILNSLSIIAQETELDFLLSQVENIDDNLKLAAATAIVKCTNNGLQILKDRFNITSETYGKIYLHVQNKLLV